MSEAETAKQYPRSGLEGVYEYTQHSFWGGAWYPYWTLVLVTIFGGFIGLDHLYLRSPSTAFLKTLVNVFGLGLWYFYDLIQICGEKETVLKYGLTAPGIGPLGIGAGMFKDDHPGEKSRAPFRYLAYMFLVCLPFGFEYLVAGDSNGALAKFVSMFLFPIGILWTLLNIFTAYFNTKSLFTHGSYRMFPFNWFMDPYGISKLGPIDQPQPQPPGECDPGGVKGLFRSIVDKFFYVMGVIRDFIIAGVGKLMDAAVNALLPGVRPAATKILQATKSVAGVVGSGADAAKTGLDQATSALEVGGQAATSIIGATGELTTKVIKAAEEPLAATIGVASDLAQKLPNAAKASAAIPSAITSKLASLASPEAIKAAAKAPLDATKVLEGMTANPLVSMAPPASLVEAAKSVAKSTTNQSGGSYSSSLEVLDTFDGSSMALFLLFVVLLGGGTYYALRRLNTSEVKESSKKKDDRDKRLQRNDAPPQS